MALWLDWNFPEDSDRPQEFGSTRDAKRWKYIREVHAMRAMLDYLRPTPRRETATLVVTQSGAAVEVSLGRKSFFIKSDLAPPAHHDVYDFALFGALAIAFSHNVEMTVDLPVSRNGAEAIQKINNMIELWQPRKTYPAPIKFNNLVEMDATTPDGAGLICLSGGVDSTYAAVDGLANRNLTHGMFIAGADFPDAQAPGFLIRKKRVADIAKKLGISLFTVETSIRKPGVQWEMSHGLILAMCLNYHSGRFGWGGISADFTPAQEFCYHPWGNNRALVSAMSTANFPIHHLGQEFSRSEKTRKIMEHPNDLMAGLSVCFENGEGGGNCGHCTKCVRTRLNILTSGRELPELFDKNDNLETLVANTPFPKHQAQRLRELTWLLDIRLNLADGPVRDAVEAYIDRLKSRIIPTGRI